MGDEVSDWRIGWDVCGREARALTSGRLGDRTTTTEEEDRLAHMSLACHASHKLHRPYMPLPL